MGAQRFDSLASFRNSKNLRRGLNGPFSLVLVLITVGFLTTFSVELRKTICRVCRLELERELILRIGEMPIQHWRKRFHLHRVAIRK